MSVAAPADSEPRHHSGSAAADDALASCLVILSHYYQRPFSLSTMLKGLPLEQGRLTLDLFPRAAAHAGLTAKGVKRSLAELSALTLPAVLLLKNGGCCIATSIDDNACWSIIQPESGSGYRTVSQDELEAAYSGSLFFVRPAFRYDQRAERPRLVADRSWFLDAFRLSRPLYGQVLLASLLINCFALILPLFVMNVYDRVVPNHSFSTLWVLTGGVALVFVFDALIRGLRTYFIDIAGKQIDVLLSACTFEHVMDLQVASRPDSVGALVSHFQEFEAFREFVTSATLTTLVDLPFTFLFLLLIFWLGGPLVLVPLLAIPLMVGLGVLLQRPLRAMVQESFRASAQKQATLIETLSALDTIKAVGAESPLQRRWEQVVGELSRLTIRTRMLSSAIISQATFIQQLAYVLLVVAGVYQIAERDMTTGGLIACTMLVSRAMQPFSQVAALISRFFQAKAALQGMDAIMHLPIERPEGKQFVHRPGFAGAIEFRDVSFAYPGQDVDALSGVSFSIAPGERVGIIGRIGSGKSTLEKLLLGFYVPRSGSVWIDGVDQRQIDPADLRHHIAYVPQDICLFYGSVRDNIVFAAPHADDTAIVEAAEMAGVTEFVNQHPMGFDMPVGERGERLSGGQRQAVAIARALLQDPPLWLFDEPTNSFDNRSEESFIRKVAARLSGKTLLLITHRASLLTLVDRLIVLERGRIVADGPKEQVLQALASGRVHAVDS
ncbi:type I secretion system permease/ATPase [Chitinilyticum piscinae]|uniref:Cyclolysin secretion/processing ATP-binding protein CyaB n=1 Tax=Chitinilyticum piscinae TaxID=2866724 RepID=A0A8J7FP90_9NEIS|nr:type I secretion system permease/ATPase [Chitinilyticum piscinae]MBE9611025.1 type I secretion system permease/ATPase [Chitinilyticum piscinae]